MKGILNIYNNGVEKFKPSTYTKSADPQKHHVCKKLKVKCISMIEKGARRIDIHNETGVALSTISNWKRELEL